MNAERILLGEWAVCMVVIAVTEWPAAAQDDPVMPLPPPSRFFKGSVGFGILGLLALGAPELAAVFGLGLVMALLYQSLASPAQVAADEGTAIGTALGKAITQATQTN